jgi:hypothetical protein
MAKKQPEIDRNPFIPARIPVSRQADTLLVFSTASAGVSAAIFVTLQQFGVFP